MTIRRAAVFGASGGIGAAVVAALAARGVPVLAGSRSGAGDAERGVERFACDITDERSIAGAVAGWRDDPPDFVLVATGVLTLADGTGPERSLKVIEPSAMAEVFRINTIGPALVAKLVLPIFPRKGRSVFAALSARVGSISDNRVGGWHSYRASKAALNMLIANFAIEMARTHPEVVIAGLHPGTVDTDLSAPFQSNLPEGQLTSPERAGENLLAVIEHLTPADSGGLFDWRGERIAP